MIIESVHFFLSFSWSTDNSLACPCFFATRSKRFPLQTRPLPSTQPPNRQKKKKKKNELIRTYPVSRLFSFRGFSNSRSLARPNRGRISLNVRIREFKNRASLYLSFPLSLSLPFLLSSLLPAVSRTLLLHETRSGSNLFSPSRFLLTRTAIPIAPISVELNSSYSSLFTTTTSLRGVSVIFLLSQAHC